MTSFLRRIYELVGMQAEVQQLPVQDVLLLAKEQLELVQLSEVVRENEMRDKVELGCEQLPVEVEMQDGDQREI